MAYTPNLLDLALLVLLIFFFVKALVRGFVREIMGLVGVVAAVLVSAMFYQPLAGFLARLFKHQAGWWEAVSFAVILLIVFSIFLYLGNLLRRLVMSGPLSGVDRLLGGVVGLAKGVLISYLLINLLLLFNPFSAMNPVRQSVLSPYVVQAGNYIVDLIPDNFITKLQEQAGLIPKKNKAKQ